MFPWSDPECAAQLCVRQLCGQFEVLEADPLSGSLVPGEQHGELERRHLQVVLTHLVLKGDLSRRKGGEKSPVTGKTLTQRRSFFSLISSASLWHVPVPVNSNVPQLKQQQQQQQALRAVSTFTAHSRCRWTWGDASGVCGRCDSSCRSLPPRGSGPPAQWAARQKPSRCSVTTLRRSGS